MSEKNPDGQFFIFILVVSFVLAVSIRDAYFKTPNSTSAARTEKAGPPPGPQFMNLPRLHREAAMGNRDRVLEELNSDPGKIDERDYRGRTPLFLAIVGKKFDVAYALLEKGAAINVADKGGNTPLLQAILAGNDELAELFIRRGANFLEANKDGFSPLHVAAREGRTRIARFLLENGAKVNAQFSDKGWTPLHHAAQRGHADIVLLLLEKGANPGARLSYGWTPLALARGEKHQDCLELLSKVGETPQTNPIEPPAEIKWLPSAPNMR